MAPQSWTGFYLGVHGGGARGDWDGRLATTAGPDVGYLDPHRTLSADGGLFGGQIGYNKQLGTVVIGFEADASWTNFGNTETYVTDNPTLGGLFAKKHDLQLDYFGTVRGRLGYAMGNFMPYITGGLAWGHAEGTLSVTYPVYKLGTSVASVEEDHVGWTAGVEAMIGGGWTVKAEYLHVDLGEEGYNFKGVTFNGQPFNTDSFKSDLTFDVVRLGLNYKLGGVYEPLK